jgi:hypothetical protein
MSNKPTATYLLIAVVIVSISIIGYNVLNAPDRRDATTRISDAVDELPNGINKAARQLESRTPAEKIEDAAHDMGDDLKRTTNQQ